MEGSGSIESTIGEAETAAGEEEFATSAPQGEPPYSDLPQTYSSYSSGSTFPSIPEISADCSYSSSDEDEPSIPEISEECYYSSADVVESSGTSDSLSSTASPIVDIF